MHLKRLKIHRFGHLAGMELEGLSPGLNLIYGPNEAGKSTVVEAVRAALYGFLAPDPGRNAYQVLGSGRRVEMELVTDDDTVLRLDRREARGAGKALLTDPEGKRVPAEELLRLMRNLDRGVFESLFAFTVEELQGLDGLGSNGVRDRVLGASLGSVKVSPQAALDGLLAAAGLARGEVVRAQEELRRAEDVLRDEEERRAHLLSRRAELGEVEDLLAELWSREKSLIREEADLGRRLDLWELGNDLIDQRRSLARTRVASPLPADALALLDELLREEEESRVEIDRLSDQVEELEGQLSHLAAEPGEETAETEAAAVAELSRGADLYEGRLKDLARTRRDLAHAEREADLLLADLGEGWDEEGVLEGLPPEGEERAIESLFEEVEHLHRALGMERVRLRQVVTAEAPRDTRLRPLVLFFGAALTVFGLLGFAVNTVAGMITSGVALFLFAILYFLARGLGKPTATVPQESRLLLDEVESALRGEPSANGRSTLVVQLAKKSAELEAALARSGFDPHLRPKEVRSHLRSLDKAARALARRRELDAGLRGLEEQLARHEALAARVARCWNLPEPVRGGLGELLAQVEDRRIDQRLAESLRHELEGRLAGSRESLAGARRRMAVVEGRLEELHRSAGTSSSDELRERVRSREQWQRKAADVERLEIAFQARSAGADPAVLLAEIESADREEIEERCRVMAAEREELRERTEGLLKRRGVLEQGPDEGAESALDDAAARVKKARREMATAIESWAADRLAVELVTSARAQMERDNQGPVLERASRIFERITDGRYTRIMAPIGSGTLEIERYDGSRITDFKTLSRGTREELYLSVRLAFVSTFCREEGRIPVMMDDVLVNFDPARAQRTAQVIADLEEDTQIFFFTCHPHVAESFRELADPNMVSLEGPQSPGISGSGFAGPAVSRLAGSDLTGVPPAGRDSG